jgi:hypothetical protein
MNGISAVVAEPTFTTGCTMFLHYGLVQEKKISSSLLTSTQAANK